MNPVNFFKCLADETRLKCLLLIAREDELCVCELMTALDEIQPKISRHLAQLRQCGLLLDRREGKWVYYRLHPEMADWQTDIIKKTHENQQDFIGDCIKNLSNMAQRPERQICC